MLLLSGVNPDVVSGTNTGVFAGAGLQDAYIQWTNDLRKNTGYEAVGNLRCMFANRLSYFFNFQGLLRFLYGQCTAQYYFTFYTVQRLCTARYLKPLLGSHTIYV